jgi:hypothetical protein
MNCGFPFGMADTAQTEHHLYIIWQHIVLPSYPLVCRLWYKISIVSEENLFQAHRQAGLVFHLAVILLLIAGAVVGLLQATRASIGPVFLLYLLPGLVSAALIPVFGYYGYALYRSYYVLQRDGIRLHWGLRIEDIPIDTIRWVRPIGELDRPVLLPWLHWPGALVGKRSAPGLGEVEFMASNRASLILIGTIEKIYAISPEDTQGFLATYQRINELGSLRPLPARSVFPTFLLARVWSSRTARILLLTGLGLSLLLLIWVSLAIPTRPQVTLGFDASGNPRGPIPSVRLLLLPVINTMVFLADTLLGFYFYREPEVQPLAYLLWAGGALSPLLFLVSVFFILQIR